ncbi:hypothetical protein BDV35DRAFT_381881 [Aspergillus flavus]|uniref:DUF7069 domain-containing protein n=1 Tax=Aspergillus flavus TaxID=5059 RepID=A0A5N6GV83_ASPFL|nr:hypothetical protein BDV35DRAFT_381881 [Aspergillus flavus]
MFCPPREEFQIGWICALPVEAAAAKEMLDESFGILDEQDIRDPNIYTLGRIGKHYIVIACLPAGQYGHTAATMVANNMIRTFSKSLRVGLMVGVGGGIPSTASDIRLGDIVISCPTGTCGGVLQYDTGKVGAGGKFTRTGSLNSPPRSLLAAVSAMRTAELTDDPHFPEYLRSAIGRTRRTQEAFARPDQQSDRLFQIEHDHPVAGDNCDACLREWEETRSEREDNKPHLHHGIVASGSSVIKHGWTREQLRMQTGALCFETEAAGLMLDFPCIVIRGICDYSDSHKNKQWQGYAALAAASYTKELLGYLPKVFNGNMILLIWHFVGSLENLNENVKGTNERLDKAYDQRERHYTEQTVRTLTAQQKKCHQSTTQSPTTCVDQNRLIQWLKDFHNQTRSSTQKNWLKFLVTSRPYDDIQNNFKSITDSFPHIHLQGEQENDQIHKEIDLVVNIKVKELATISSLSTDVEQQLRYQLLQMEHRTYLWLYLAIDDIRNRFQESLDPTEVSIELIPSSVNEAYERILARVPLNQVNTPTNLAQGTPSNGKTPKEQCLKSAFDTWGWMTWKPTKNKQNLIYNVFCHIQQSTGLTMFEGCPRHNSKKWLIWRSLPKLDAVHLAAFNGHSHVLRLIITSEENTINKKDSTGATALMWASYNGYYEAVEMLLSKGADINAQGRQYETALQVACCRGHDQVVQILLEKGANIHHFRANIHHFSGKYGNALQAASLGGHDRIVQMLLERGADVNAGGGHDGSALQAASSEGHVQIVQMLLEKGADVNAGGGHDGSALQVASSEGHVQIVQMLLEKGADVNADGGHFGSALQVASSKGHVQIVQMLLENGANVNDVVLPDVSGKVHSRFPVGCVSS